MADGLNLGAELDGIVDSLVTSGHYESREAVLSEGVLLVQKRAAAIARFEAEIQKGIDDVEAGRTRPAEEVFAELRAKYLAMAAQRSAA